jgi:hypothetical protein
MPISEEEFYSLLHDHAKEHTGADAPRIEGGQWAALFERHPEGGGPFGGRDNALVKLLGFLRAKSFPYQVALAIAEWWDAKFVDPPLGALAIRDKMSRGWVEWLDGGIPDDRPDSVGKSGEHLLEFIGLDRLAELAAAASDTQWIVQDLIISGGIHFVTAPPGGGKTWVAVDLLRACLTGTKWLLNHQAQRISCLYINEEMSPGTFFDRLSRMSVPSEGLTILQRSGVRLDSPSDLEQIVEHIKSRSIRLVIVDTFVRVHRLDENSNVEMASLYQRLKAMSEAGAAVVCLHHHRKSAAGGGPVEHEAMRGAGEIAAQADLIASIDKRDGVYRFHVTKHRHLEEGAVEDVGFGIETSDDNLVSLCHSELPDTASTLPVQGRKGKDGTPSPSDRILAVLSENPGIGLNRVQSLARVKRETCQAVLAELEAGGLIQSVTKDKWPIWFVAGA